MMMMAVVVMMKNESESQIDCFYSAGNNDADDCENENHNNHETTAVEI